MTDPFAKIPDLQSCVAQPAGSSDLVFCLSEQRTACGYALPFGASYFCRHPEARVIAARETAERDGSAVGQ